MKRHSNEYDVVITGMHFLWIKILNNLDRFTIKIRRTQLDLLKGYHHFSPLHYITYFSI
jgi:hypothetical protein